MRVSAFHSCKRAMLRQRYQLHQAPSNNSEHDLKAQLSHSVVEQAEQQHCTLCYTRRTENTTRCKHSANESHGCQIIFMISIDVLIAERSLSDPAPYIGTTIIYLPQSSSSSSDTSSPASIALALRAAALSVFLTKIFFRFFATLNTPPVPAPQAAQLGSLPF